MGQERVDYGLMISRSQNGPRELPARLRGPLFRYRELLDDFAQAQEAVERIRAELGALWLQLTDEERAEVDAPEGE